MRRSIRTFLLINLLISVTIVTCLSIMGNLYIDHKNIRAQLDARLPIQAFTIRALVTHDLINRDFTDLQQQIREIPRLTDHFFKKIPNKRLSDFYGPVEVQIWNKRGQILLRTQNAPHIRLAGNAEGFADKWINKRHWRVFTTIDPHTQLVIAVAQRYNFRDQLETRITRDALIIMLLTYPVLGILIWFIVGRGLRSIRLVAKALTARRANYLEPVSLTKVPVEIKPLVKAINDLFERLDAAFTREKRFAADAAHELRTPLAAVMIQAQVAANADNPQERFDALNKVLAGVNRSTHVVDQLLTMSKMLPDATVTDMDNLDLVKLAAEVIAHQVPKALAKNITIELMRPKHAAIIKGNATALAILLRNLIDNAIRYSPKGSEVLVVIKTTTKSIELQVIDSGPGIPEELRQRVFERFYRAIGTTESGSGLGLSIVEQITKLHNATIKLDTPKSGQGLQISLTFKR